MKIPNSQGSNMAAKAARKRPPVQRDLFFGSSLKCGKFADRDDEGVAAYFDALKSALATCSAKQPTFATLQGNIEALNDARNRFRETQRAMPKKFRECLKIQDFGFATSKTVEEIYRKSHVQQDVLRGIASDWANVSNDLNLSFATVVQDMLRAKQLQFNHPHRKRRQSVSE